MKLSIILPIHNERENLGLLLEELSVALAPYSDSEIIAVDDGSTDGSLEEMKSLAQKYPMLRVLEMARNYGQTAAISAGMEAATGDVFLPMDADMQNDPKDIPLFIAKLDEGYDIVSGWRKDRHDAFLRSFLSKIANRLIRRASGQTIHDYGCTMKAYKRSAIADLGLYGDMHRFLPAYAAMHGAKVVEVEAHHRPRTKGVSKYGFGRVWRVILDLLLLTFFLKSFTRPMQFFGGIGLLMNLLGFLTILFALFLRWIGGPTLIDTPLPELAALFVIVGVQCILMGVLAETVMRTYFQSGGKKPYRVRAVFPPKS